MSIGNYTVTPQEDTPFVNFDASTGRFEIKGMSRPEDVTKFYNPMIDWLKKYGENPASETVINFQYVYFNTASARKIYEVLAAFDQIHQSGKSKVTINWYFDEPDIDMKMAGEEYNELLDLDIQHHSVSVE